MVGQTKAISLLQETFREGKTRPDWNEMPEEEKEVLKPDVIV